MKKAGGRGRETGDDRLAHCVACIRVAWARIGTFDIELGATSWHRPPVGITAEHKAIVEFEEAWWRTKRQEAMRRWPTAGAISFAISLRQISIRAVSRMSLPDSHPSQT